MAKKKQEQREANARRHLFLLSLFPDQKQEYAVLYINGFVLIRQWNGGTNTWNVAIWDEDTFKRIHGLLEGHPTGSHDIESE